MTGRAEAPPRFHPRYWDPTAPAPRFSVGKRVRVRAGAPPGHVRTPWFVRGAVGVVERVCGHFANPEELAYGRPGTPKLPLYRVRFALSDLWPEAADDDGGFGREDTLDVELYESWLEPFFDYGADPAAEAAKVASDIARRGASSGPAPGAEE